MTTFVDFSGQHWVDEHGGWLWCAPRARRRPNGQQIPGSEGYTGCDFCGGVGHRKDECEVRWRASMAKLIASMARRRGDFWVEVETKKLLKPQSYAAKKTHKAKTRGGGERQEKKKNKKKEEEKEKSKSKSAKKTNEDKKGKKKNEGSEGEERDAKKKNEEEKEKTKKKKEQAAKAQEEAKTEEKTKRKEESEAQERAAQERAAQERAAQERAAQERAKRKEEAQGEDEEESEEGEAKEKTQEGSADVQWHDAQWPLEALEDYGSEPEGEGRAAGRPLYAEEEPAPPTGSAEAEAEVAVAAAETEAQLQELMKVVIWDDAKRAESMIECGMTEQYREYLGVYTVEEQCDRERSRRALKAEKRRKKAAAEVAAVEAEAWGGEQLYEAQKKTALAAGELYFPDFVEWRNRDPRRKRLAIVD